MSSLKKIILVFVVIILFSIFFINHNKNNENFIANNNFLNDVSNVSENLEYDEEIKNENNENNVINNGSNFVQYEGNTYFWKLNEQSREKVSVNENYINQNVQNELICMTENGEQQVILTDFGFGKIYILKNRIYLTCYSESLETKIYSVDLNGNDKKEYNDIKSILGFNENYIVYENDSKLYSINIENDKVYELFQKSEYNYLGIYGDTIYYNKMPQYGDSTITFKSMNCEGKRNKVIKEISNTNIQLNNDYSPINIIQFDVDEENYYISYGYYDENNKIQDSEITIFKIEDPKSEFFISDYSKFELYKEQENKYLIAISETPDISSQVINVNTLKIENIEIPSALISDNIVLKDEFLQENQIENEQITASYKNFEIIENYAYYILDISKYIAPATEEENGLYEQIKSYCIKQNIETNEYQILYEF